MARPVPPCPSANQVDKAGNRLRAILKKDAWDEADFDALNTAGDTMLAFRAAHQYPLTKATMGLRSVVTTEKCRVEVTQRLKRVTTILDKIQRYPTLRLSSMQDLGGCRAVLDTVDEVRRVERRVKKNRQPIKVSDYITTPKPSGYRGVHVVVLYDQRAIEIQLRTRVMHEWAYTVERVSGRLQEDLKSSKGPPVLLDLFSTISGAMAIEEAGGIVGQDFLDHLADLRQAAVPYLEGGSAHD